MHLEHRTPAPKSQAFLSTRLTNLFLALLHVVGMRLGVMLPAIFLEEILHHYSTMIVNVLRSVSEIVPAR